MMDLAGEDKLTDVTDYVFFEIKIRVSELIPSVVITSNSSRPTKLVINLNWRVAMVPVTVPFID